MLIILPLLVLGFAGAQKNPDVSTVPPNTEEIPFIQCQTCTLLVTNALKWVKDAMSQKQALDEELIKKTTDHVCDPLMGPGEWIAQQDITLSSNGNKLSLVDMHTSGLCKKECRTVAAACQRVLDDIKEDLSDALLSKNHNVKQLQESLCVHESPCQRKAKGKVPSRIDEEFEPQASQDRMNDVVQQTMAKLSKQFGTSFGAKARAVSKAEMEKMQKEGKLDEL